MSLVVPSFIVMHSKIPTKFY